MSDEKTDCVATLVSGASYATGKRRFVNGKPMSVTREEAAYLESTGAFNIQRPSEIGVEVESKKEVPASKGKKHGKK